MLRLALFALLIVPVAASADPKKPTFDDDVLPVLKQHCLACHGNDKQQAGLNLATMTDLKAGGSSGDVVKAGDPGKSRLYTLTAHLEKPEMPPKAAKIADAQLDVLKLWIEQGLRENAGSKAAVVEKPKVDIGVKAPARGKPTGPPPMPAAGKLAGDPLHRVRRPGAVTALAAAPWSPLVAVAGARQVLLFHTDSSDLLGALPFEHGQINSLRFSRNGKFLLAAGGRGGASGKAVLFDVETCAKVTEVGIETDAILAADVSPDQTMIAVGSPSKLVRVYNTADGSVAREIKKHTDWVTAVEFSPDGVLLATGDRNGGLFAWEAATGREFHALRGHTAGITDLSWSLDANALATASEDGTVRVWEMENGTAAKTIPAHPSGVASVKYGPDGKIATTGRDKLAKLWDANGGAIKSFPDAFPDLGLKVAFAHDGGKVIAGDWAGNLRAWAAADGKLAYAADTNPAPFAERLKAVEAVAGAAEAKQKAAQAAFATAEGNAKQAQAAHADVVARVAKITADIAGTKAVAAEKAKAAEAAKAELGKLDTEFNKLAPKVSESLEALRTAEVGVAKMEVESKQAKTMLDADPKNAKLEAEHKKALAALEKAKQGLPGVEQANKALVEKSKELSANVQKAKQTAADADKGSAEAQKAAAAVPLLLAPAQAAVAPAKAAADAAAKAVEPAKAALEAANADAAAAKAKLEAMKARK